MAKVDWITWKTEPNDIINPDKIFEEISNKVSEYNTYTKTVIYDSLQQEIKKGGLSADSLVLNGTSLANEKALTIIDNLQEIQCLIQSLKTKIKTTTEDQKQVEKQQLIEALQAKIEEEEKVKNNTVSLNEKLQSENTVVKKDTVENIIENTDQKINQLKEKLETIKAM